MNQLRMFPEFTCLDFWRTPEYVKNERLDDEIHELIKESTSVSNLSNLVRNVNERIKQLAAEELKPGSDEPIVDLYLLDYIWELDGDYVIESGKPYHARALDYYVGRRVEGHMLGDGVLEKLPKELKRGNGYGIRLEVLCLCGGSTTTAWAIPGIHNGGFGYITNAKIEAEDFWFDIRNHCIRCGPDCMFNNKVQ